MNPPRYELVTTPCATCSGSGKAPRTPGGLPQTHYGESPPQPPCPACHGTKASRMGFDSLLDLQGYVEALTP